MEYNFKDINKTFNISYFSENKDLVGNQFVESQFLKDYESIENISSNLITILIKKFKLRISFKKINNFSTDIVICDDYKFNPNILNHSDNILKIAIIKNNFDDWIKSDLNQYDYIFTIKEYHDDLKKIIKCFIIEEMSIYEQIKYILNELYRRKSDKFYLFLKNVNFNKIFPHWANYFKVLNSEYFDDEWYRKTYNINLNTDSVIHFLLVGFEKGYDPGPNFSSSEYYECNRDVAITGVNPLVHYEKYGRKENRILKISDTHKRDYSLILESPFFDGDWYCSVYDVGDVDPVDHYLNVGYACGFNPGPDFNTYQYYERNKDVKNLHMNPLLHYELYGKKEKRAIQLSKEQYSELYSLILESPFFDGDWYCSVYDVGDVDPVDHYLNIGYACGFNPGPDFSTSEYYECNDDVKDYGMNPLVHYEKYGRDENRIYRASDISKRNYSLILESPFFDGDWYCSVYDVGDVDPVDHYLNVGYACGFNPGPDFSTFQYYECNDDIKKSHMNPLLHYELHGRNENRVYKFDKERYIKFYNAISNSPFFDGDWYCSVYDVGDIGPVDHYLNIGYARGFNPGPDFSTNDYYEVNPDVKDYGMNPLVHYELYGRNEKRKLQKNR